VDPFSPRLLQIDDGKPSALKPVPFQGRVDELTLERWIVENPDLVGEPLLVLGHQLAEFEEDKDRLDILALDRSGEIVLVELKVSEDFRVTDLQALAYAGAYAKRSKEDLARTLQRHLQKRANAQAQVAAQAVGATDDPPATEGTPAAAQPAQPTAYNGAGPAAPDFSAPATISFDDAAAQIEAFIEVDDFDDWQPSQHVRIKLVAPNFPRRVLQTVKWLGDVYSVRLEAITVRLFETAPQKYSIAFERLLPLPAEEDFDMTIRERENRQRVENTTRRPAVLPLLVNAGKITHGQQLCVTQRVLINDYKHLYDPDHPAFQARVHAPAGANPKLAWKPSDDAPEEILSPSMVPYKVYCAIVPGDHTEFSSPVASSFSLTRGGQTLAELALETGVWDPVE
jgi:hypothetical protein